MALVYKRNNPGESLHWQAQWELKDKVGKKISPGNYRAEIEIMTIADADREKIEDSQLRTIIEFTLPGSEQSAKNENSQTYTGQEDTLDHRRSEEGIIKAENAKEIIAELAEEVIHAISSKDAEKLAQYVHPEGMRFTPYTYVDEKKDIVFTQDEVRNFFADQNLYLWGCYDGTGYEIKLTPGEYYKEFIYSADFVNAEQIGYNQVLSSGNMLENQFEVYTDPIVVEYYFPGFDPEFIGMDWRSLRLVFEKCENKEKAV